MGAPIEKSELKKLVSAYKKHGNIRQAALDMGITYDTAKKRLQSARAQDILDPSFTPTKPSVPLSEDQKKFHAKWTAHDCIGELNRIAKIDTEKFITRNYFRNNSKISESTWTRYFGTFEEFKRQASIMPTRQQHGLERHIAKHASVDHYRKISIDRQDYDAKYERPKGKRFKTIITCSDLHDIECDPFYLRVLIDTCARVSPDVVCFVGDVFDLPEFGRYGVDPREWDVVGRIKHVHKNIFKPLREVCPDVQFDFIEGNHEARLLKHLADETPALRAVLSDLHGMTVSSLLGLDEFQINYVAKGDLAAFSARDSKKELAKNFKIYDGCFLAHHFPEGRNLGLAGVCGHHHQDLIWSHYDVLRGNVQFHQMGAGHKLEASYCMGEKWSNSFRIVTIDTKTKKVNLDSVQTSNGFAISGGKHYMRNKGE